MTQEGDSSIPLRLLEEGYDVWLGNTRGNKYSRNHLFKDPDTSGIWDSVGFWDFSVDQIGLNDIPTLIN
jgi:lysosomal acid lipase/cholesteryl ester hydrolase